MHHPALPDLQAAAHELLAALGAHDVMEESTLKLVDKIAEEVCVCFSELMLDVHTLCYAFVPVMFYSKTEFVFKKGSFQKILSGVSLHWA